MLWGCGETLWQEEGRIRGDEDGRVWRAAVTGAKGMELAREGFPSQEEERISYIKIERLRIYK